MNLAEIEQLEQEWLEREGHLRQDPILYGWEPYPPSRFLALLQIAAAQFEPGPDIRFLDVGGGIGTKALIAKQMGMDAWSIEMFPEYVLQSVELGVSTIRADIRTFDGYGAYDILYVNHPIREPDEQDKLEHEIHVQMKLGAVLITVHNMRMLPLNWKLLARPLHPEQPDRKLRYDWVAMK